MAAIVEEIESKINQLSEADRGELLRRLNENAAKEPKPNGAKKNGQAEVIQKNVDSNIEWIKKNKDKYAGSYVALKDGKLIAIGRTIKEADQASKMKGVKNPFLHYIFPKDYIPFGGW